MPNFVNFVVVQCEQGIAHAPTDVINGATLVRTPRSQPATATSGSTAPTGPQLWPLKL
jgi:hypothetical protein